ncbi:MAG: TIGR03089 family protein [Jatrophihabitans sp.]
MASLTGGTPTPETLFADRLQADPGGPLVTFYDDRTGERAELSARSLANWVAKTHFMVQDGLGLGPGDQAVVRLPVHWLAAPILLGCWFAGLEVLGPASPRAGTASVLFADAAGLAELAPIPGAEVFAVSLLSMARPDVPPPGAHDYATAVRPMPDSWATVRAQADPGQPALDGLDRAGLASSAARVAGELGLSAGGRLLWTTEWSGPADWVAALLAPLAVRGSVVLVAHPDPARSAARAATEQVTLSH